ncbi:MAG: glutathione peroxidase [Gemmatimonas sp.]|jgi:glutathione peroxidase|uniref:glutathione peroxidase n=1 Tax=Gemmatimonas sp. TaxID=1962908 RepID=UPI00391FBF5F
MRDRIPTPRSSRASGGSLADFTLPSIDGTPLPMADLAGRVILMVNVASQCGFTPQYRGLEQLWRTYRERGLTIVGCPCDQFGHQEPGAAAEIAQFCSTRYDVTFPLSAKLEVNGDRAHPLWQWLRVSAPGLLGTTAIKWNFTKFLIGRDGTVLERFAPTVAPEDLAPRIEQALAAAAT